MVSVREAAFAVFEHFGVDRLFGNPGSTELPMLKAMPFPYVMGLNEAVVMGMADGYARSSGKPALVNLHSSAGTGHSLGNLFTAYKNNTPIVVTAGQQARSILPHDPFLFAERPTEFPRPYVKFSIEPARAEDVPLALARAFARAMTPPMGPVTIEIPIDIQRAAIPRPPMLDGLKIAPPAPDAGDAASLDALAEMAAKAKRPMLWCGTGARYARDAVERLAAMGFGIVTSINGRAVIPETHPMTLGAFNAVPRVEKLYEDVDLMIVAGGRMRGHETKDLQLKLPTRRIHVDIDPEAFGRTYDAEHYHVGEAGAALSALADRLDGRMQVAVDWGDTIASTREEVHAAYRPTLGPYADFAQIVRDAMPDDSYWVRDITISNSTWGNRYLPLSAPEQNIYPVGAAIGPGYQMGIGAAMADASRKTVAMTGDGGFYLNMTELWTAAQENADVVIMVMNDQGYGVIKDIQNTLYGGRHYAADPIGPDLEGLAQLAGMPFWRVSALDELGPKLKEAIAVDGPALVEVDMTQFGPYPPYFVAPPYAAKS